MTAASPSASTAPALKPPLWLAMAGTAWILAGFALSPSYRFYQVLLCLLLWLPALFFIGHQRRDFAGVLRSPAGLLFVLVSCWALLSLLWSRSPKPLSDLRDIPYTWLSLAPLVLMARLAPDKAARALLWCVPVAAAAALAALISFYVIDGHALTYRMWGLGQLDHELVVGRYFATLTIVMFTLIPARHRYRPLPLLALALMLAVVFLSQNRSVWGALIAALAVWVVMDLDWRRLIPMALIGAAGLALLLCFPEALLKRGLSGRPELWQDGLALWSQHPWMGLGLGSDYTLFRSDNQEILHHTHNLLIHVGITTGLLGVLLFAALWLVSGVSLWRHRSLPLARCGFIWWVFASVAFLVDGAYLWSKPDDTWFQIWMTIAIALGVGSRPGFARHDGD